jgi:U3 small nucleolar RNA-associated protein 12
MGNLPLASSHRVSQIMFHPHHPFLAIQSHENSLELFRIRTEEEVKKKLARREKRRNEKAKNPKAIEQTEQTEKHESTLTDTLVPYCVVRPSGKIRSFSFPQDVQSSSTTKNLTV